MGQNFRGFDEDASPLSSQGRAAHSLRTRRAASMAAFYFLRARLMELP